MKTCFSLGLVGLSLAALSWCAGIRFNLTESMPMGIYRETSEIPVRGDAASFCLASSSSTDEQSARYLRPSLLCPNSLQPLLKEIAALPGDRIEVSPEGLSINGRAVPHFRIKKHDRQGRPVVSRLASGPVPEGMALALGRNAGSFDGRYFGFVPLRSCRKVIPLLVFPRSPEQ